MRQLSDAAGAVILAQNYEPYGETMNVYGTGASNYGYAGEWTDGTGLQHLRARYMDPGTGRFLTRDTWAGEYNSPMSLNRWMYVMGNPVMYTDPSGYAPACDWEIPGDCPPEKPIPGPTPEPTPETHLCKENLSLCRVRSTMIPGLIQLENWVDGSFSNHWTGDPNSQYDGNVGINWAEPLCEWGVKGDECTYAYPNPSSEITGVVLHHGGHEGASDNNIRTDDPHYFNIVMSWHLNPKNTYSDRFTICYHFGIDSQGKIYEGRPIRLRGCHLAGANTGKLGILLFGNFNDVKPTDKQIQSTISLISGLNDGGYNLHGTNISTHKSFDPYALDNACPGENFTDAYLEKIIKGVH
ncbi:MAG: N-acetylmuramoyl-L-alanine amidase [Nitrosopumilus sp.]|nr:N-acetylmuramoyl-L-alanine amidase [Nitrosopumilus sp.]